MNNEDQVQDTVDEALFHFAYRRYVDGLHPNAALNAVRREIPLIAEPLIARSSMVGHIPGVHIGDEFNYRAETFLVGLHDDLIRGISLAVTNDGIDIASCAVVVYERHNTFLDDDLLYSMEVKEGN